MWLWYLFGALELSFVLFFAIFISTIRKKYIATFFTTVTAKEFNVRNYCEATTDQARSDVFGLHPSYYSSIRGEVKDWVRENWIDWIEENPEWFTSRLRAQIPADMIPES